MIIFEEKDKYLENEVIIKQQRGDFKVMPHNQKAFHGCSIIYRFIEFYNQWEKLRDTEMVINPKFRNLIIRSGLISLLNYISLF